MKFEKSTLSSTFNNHRRAIFNIVSYKWAADEQKIQYLQNQSNHASYSTHCPTKAPMI
jgi:hypothetical protein